MTKKYKIFGAAISLLLTTSVSSCKKFVEVNTPITQISTESAFKTDANASSIVTGIYAQLVHDYVNKYNLGATSFIAELSADNLVIVPGLRPDQDVWYQNSLTPAYALTGNAYWTNVYSMMYTVNISIESLTDNQALTPAVSKRLLGEAYFLRGFFYFYLVNLYGDVPLVLNSLYKNNSRIAKNSTAEIYSQIILDLGKAEQLLDNNYVTADLTTNSDKRLRPNLAAVNALKARVFLYKKDYASAETAASKVIMESSQYSLTDLNATFLANSPETIWALQPVDLGYNTFEAQLYTLPSGGPDYDRPSSLSDSFMQSFEPGDDRKNEWVGNVTVGTTTYSYPSKYKQTFIDGSRNFVEYPIVLRLGEQYLIRAEARNELGNTGGAIEDLNVLRTRSRAEATTDVPKPLPNLSSLLDQSALRSVILNERRVELFTEWGHRWFDLRRSGKIDAVMTEAEKYKGGTWEPYKAMYPIPSSEILLNALLKQNPGYTN